jgi:hypothetical protein
MVTSEYGAYSQYVLQGVHAEVSLPPLPVGSVTNMAYLDGKVIPGAWNVICAWFWPRQEPLVVIPDPHHHDEHEVVCFYGSNPDDPFDLCGEVEFYMEGQKLTLTRSSLIYVPACMEHSPMILTRVDRPIFHFSSVTESSWERRHSSA